MTQPAVPEPPELADYDPTYLHSLRELKVILMLFAVFCSWSVTTCWIVGYRPSAEPEGELWTILGMPAWVFLGIGVPWVAVDVVAVWFCFAFMKSDNLNVETSPGIDELGTLASTPATGQEGAANV